MNLCKSLLVSQLFATTVSSKSLRGGSTIHRDLGVFDENRIIGGTEATEGRYSYAVSLQNQVGHFCGGSLIAPDIVLSAAHCMQGDAYKAVIGRHSLETDDGDEVAVKAEIVHPEYDWDNNDNDVMVLVLDRSTTEDVQLIQVNPDDVSVGSAVTVMGWGDIHPSASIQKPAIELMETEVFVISNEECEQSSGTVGGTELFGWTIGGYEVNYNDQITDNMMCAKDSGEDSCQGDSGGPLVVRSDSGDLQVGVVSWGVGCASKHFPGVYARISAQYDWVKSTVCEMSSDPPASFNCDGRVGDSFVTQDLASGQDDEVGWVTITEEDFTYGFGLFNHHENYAKHYTTAANRAGVVRIAGGQDGNSVLTSNLISLENSSFISFRINFSFYAFEMEHSDKLCLDYEIDDGVITGEKCWSSLHAFENDRWYNDKSLVFGASSVNNLRIRFRVEGDDDVDDVLLDYVIIEGKQ